MKKNFLKKLSFVLSCAMTVSMVAPASTSFAASAPALSAKSVCLYLGVKGKNTYNFNVKNNKSTYKQTWYVKDKSIASIKASNGVVTAKKTGTTTIGVKLTNKKTKKVVKKIYGKVLVRDNIATLTITNKPAGDTLKVNAENDFNRSYVAKSGSTTRTSGKTYWTVSPATGATISSTGVFKATTAGEFTITARAFQSSAKHKSWLTDNTKYASYVTATDSYKVKVTSGMVSAKQLTVRKINVAFDSPMTDVKSKLSVSYLLGSTKVPAEIKNVTMSSDNKEATVEFYVDFNAGSTYVVDCTGMQPVQFVAATTKVEDVASMAITTTQAQVQKDTDVNVALYNKDKVNILTDELKNRITNEIVTSSNNAFFQSNGKLYMYNVGDTANLKATFHTWTYDNGQEKVLTATGTVTCVKEITDTIKAIDVYTIGDADKAPVFYKDRTNQISLNDSNKKVYVRYKINKADGTEDTQNNYDNADKFKFSTGDVKYLQVNEDGRLYPVAAGVANVIVKYNDTAIDTVKVVVGANRQLNSIQLVPNTKTSYKLSASVGQEATVRFTAKDQFNADYKGYNLGQSYWYNGKDGSIGVKPAAGSITFNAEGAVPGTYTYYIKAADNSSNRVASTNSIRITVVKAGDTKSFALDLNNDNNNVYDTALTGTHSEEKVYANLYGLDQYGEKSEKADLSKYTVKLTHNGNPVTGYSIEKDGTLVLNLTPATNGAITKLEKGDYVLTVTSGSSIKYDKNFAVRDNQITPKVAQDKYSTSKKSITEQLQDCLTVTFDNRNIESEITNINYDTTSYGVVIRSFDWVQKFDNGNTFTHHVKGNYSITVNND